MKLEFKPEDFENMTENQSLTRSEWLSVRANVRLTEMLKDAPVVYGGKYCLGGDSDPRFLYESVPSKYPFLKTCFLEFACPSRKGRNLYTHLMAYAFGVWPKSKVGARVIPTKHMSKESGKKVDWHPCPMRVSHCSWLVKWFGDGGVIDPFAGSGSFGVACKKHLVPYLGFEINETWAKKAQERINNEQEPWC